MEGEKTSAGYPQPIGPWPRRLTQGAVRMITPAELKAWMVFEDDRMLVVNKPGDVVCHPSKDGPWSSMSGAVREYTGAESAHLVFRLDRETSGLVLFAKDPAMARRLQMAAQERRYAKAYLVLLHGTLNENITVNQPLGPDFDSAVSVKSRVTTDGSGQSAVTHYLPVVSAGGFTLARVITETGRKHQIRAHAQWLGRAVVGDKIYGPDANLFLEFIENGWSAELAAKLILPRQALHCSEIDLRLAGVDRHFYAPLPADMSAFCREQGMDPKTPLPEAATDIAAS